MPVTDMLWRRNLGTPCGISQLSAAGLKIPVDEILVGAASGENYAISVAANDLLDSPISHVATPLMVPELDAALLQLGESAAGLFVLRTSIDNAKAKVAAFADWYLRALKAARVTFTEVVRMNIAKTRGRFIAPDYAGLPTFDHDFPEEERLPRHSARSFAERAAIRPSESETRAGQKPQRSCAGIASGYSSLIVEIQG
jgi:hypothetical protein